MKTVVTFCHRQGASLRLFLFSFKCIAMNDECYYPTQHYSRVCSALLFSFLFFLLVSRLHVSPLKSPAILSSSLHPVFLCLLLFFSFFFFSPLINCTCILLVWPFFCPLRPLPRCCSWKGKKMKDLVWYCVMPFQLLCKVFFSFSFFSCMPYYTVEFTCSMVMFEAL